MQVNRKVVITDEQKGQEVPDKVIIKMCESGVRVDKSTKEGSVSGDKSTHIKNVDVEKGTHT